jgi:hypothetical protein
MHVVGIGDTLGARKTCNKAANTQMEPTRQTVMHDDVAAARRNKIGPQSVPEAAQQLCSYPDGKKHFITLDLS